MMVVPAKDVRSLCWRDDWLVDLVMGRWFHPDGSTSTSQPYRAYRFDAGLLSPFSNRGIVYERFGTKAVLFTTDAVLELRELNRSYYCANAFEYPICFLSLPDGREAIAHCPDEYNRLELEVCETGERLTTRESKAHDFFHSRLMVNPDGRHLISAGWVWHPFEATAIYDIATAIADPAHLDSAVLLPASETNGVCWVDDDHVCIASCDDAVDVTENPGELPERQIGLLDIRSRHYRSIAPISEEPGTLLPFDEDHVLSLYDHPKLVQISTGSIVRRWPELATGRQNGSIVVNKEIPVYAYNSTRRRLAVAGPDAILIIDVMP